MNNTQNNIEPIKEKLDDKIKKLNSSRVYKKVTPRGDLSWYIKWASSITLIFAMLFTSANMFPINLYIANIGFIGWLTVGMLWHATFQYILDNFGKHEERIKFAALIHNKPSKTKVDYHGYQINKDEAPAWIVFPWEEWDK